MVEPASPLTAEAATPADEVPWRLARPLETLLPLERREALRDRLLAETPSWYVPWVHLFVPSTVGLAVIAYLLSFLSDLRMSELLTVPVTYLIANATEWLVHREALHRRNPLAPVLYDQHTPKHHMIYVTNDMGMRDRREYRLVLIPAYGLFLIFAGSLPITGAIWALGYTNVAILYAVTAMGYAVSYEWLHFSYHLPETNPIAHFRLIKMLRHHHAVHHDPRIMQRWNLNVTVPLWDFVMGTTVRDDAVPAPRSSSAIS